MDRVRTGLTGLGLVFLFTLAASAILSPEPRSGKAKDAAEPLAQLGVAPGAESPGHDLRAHGGEATRPAAAASERGGEPGQSPAPEQPAERPVAGGPGMVDLPRDETLAI
jgi:hypothetical protein